MAPGDVLGLAEGMFAALADPAHRVPLDKPEEFTEEVAVRAYLRLTQCGSG